MSLSDPLGDMLARIKNGQLRKKESVVMPASRFRGNVLDVLHREGYIRGFKKVEIENNKNEFEIEDLQRNFDGLGISILSTSKGVLSDNEARTEKVGGEILCKVF